MRAVVQRVNRAQVTVRGNIVGKINKGLIVFLACGKGDMEEDAEYIVRKIANLRIFPDAEGKMNLSVKDIGGEILMVSQFTLYGDVRKGNRPSFDDAIDRDAGEKLYRLVIDKLKGEKINVEEGKFGAHMIVEVENDGPVTILLDSKKCF